MAYLTPEQKALAETFTVPPCPQDDPRAQQDFDDAWTRYQASHEHEDFRAACAAMTRMSGAAQRAAARRMGME